MMTAIVTAPTLWRRVGVGVSGWRSGRVHPVSRGRRVSVGAVGHVGASTKPCSYWLTSWCCRAGGEGRRRNDEGQNIWTLWHCYWCSVTLPWAATCSMYWPNSIAPPAAKTNLNVALPSQPPEGGVSSVTEHCTFMYVCKNTPTSRLCGDSALDVIGSQHRLFDLAAFYQVEGHHEGLQCIPPFSQKDHLGGNSRD